MGTYNQLMRKSIKLNDTWMDSFCHKCGMAIMQGDPWREVEIGWSEVLQIAYDLWGAPIGFFCCDFLVVLEFEQVKLVFCAQGPRRGEVEISVPVDDEQADEQLRTLLERIRAIVEDHNNTLEGESYER